MPKEINEDFGLDDRNFHPEEQLIHSVSRKKRNKRLKHEQDKKTNKSKSFSDDTFDKKDKSDL
jgi:hypothetical protein